ncbi:hypothetical protein SAMN05519103_08893 [Rhizobiales bacterium GAS113]|nr:hypothetical protein SAMN05519103_08893 [Rhizobiales bacterium GAS113]
MKLASLGQLKIAAPKIWGECEVDGSAVNSTGCAVARQKGRGPILCHPLNISYDVVNQLP